MDNAAALVGESRTREILHQAPRATRSRWILGSFALLLVVLVCGIIGVSGPLALLGQSGRSQASALPTLAAQEPDYSPFSEKSRWTYSIEYRAGIGVQKGKSVVRVDGTESINGKRYYKVVTVFSGIPGAEPDTRYVRPSKEGFYVVRDKSQPEFLMVPRAPSIGSTWTVKEGDGRVDYRVEAIETAELFDAKYENCLKVSYEGIAHGKTIRGYAYYAPDVGQVKDLTTIGKTLEFFGKNVDLVTSEMTLEKYEK